MCCSFETFFSVIAQFPKLHQTLCHSLNPYTYEGNVEIDQIEDATERRAILSQIDKF